MEKYNHQKFYSDNLRSYYNVNQLTNKLMKYNFPYVQKNS